MRYTKRSKHQQTQRKMERFQDEDNKHGDSCLGSIMRAGNEPKMEPVGVYMIFPGTTRSTCKSQSHHASGAAGFCEPIPWHSGDVIQKLPRLQNLHHKELTNETSHWRAVPRVTTGRAAALYPALMIHPCCLFSAQGPLSPGNDIIILHQWMSAVPWTSNSDSAPYRPSG